MNKNKNKLMLLICSCCPGAGHMYMGIMKQGLSIMTMFFALIFIATFLRVGAVMYLLPILWFYSFFDCWNKRNLKDEDFYGIQDDYLMPFLDGKTPKVNLNKARPYIAILCILIGLERLLYYFGNMIEGVIPNAMHLFFRTVWYNYSDLLFSILLIWIGIRLIMGKKKDMEGEGMEKQMGAPWKEEGE